MTYDLAIEAVLPSVPASWQIEQFRRLAWLTSEPRGELPLKLLSLSSDGVVTPRQAESGLGRQAPAEHTIRRYWVTHPGDLVVNPMWLIGGGIGVSNVHGAVSPDYRVYRLRPELHPRYAHYLLRSKPYRDQYRLYTRADTTFDRRVSKENFHPMPVLVPSIDEQRRIADFIDVQTARMNRLANLRARQINVLEAGEDSTLHELTNGLDVPQVPLKRLVTRVTSGPRGWGELIADEGTTFLRITNIPRHGITLDLRNLAKVIAPPGPERERTRTRFGDVLVSITADIGSVAIVDERAVNGNVSQHVAILRPDPHRCEPRWLAYVVKAPAARQQLKMASYGGTKVGLGLADVAELRIPAPDLRFQRMRASYIDTMLERFERARTAILAQVALLAERREALITAAVTGQIDVTTAGGGSS